MLVSAMLIMPASSAVPDCKEFQDEHHNRWKGVFSVFSGIWTSFILNLPTGGTIIIINFVILMLTLAYRTKRQLKEKNPVKVEANK